MRDDEPASMPVDFPAGTRPSRKLDERIWARFPGVARITTAAVLALPRRSALRRRLVVYWVVRSWEIFNRRDVEIALAAQDPDVRIHYARDPEDRMPPDFAGEFHGHDGFRRGWAAWFEAFEDLRVEPEEVTDLGAGRLLIRMRSVGRGARSGALVEMGGYAVFTFRSGRLAEHLFFFDREQAERAAGLRR